MKNKQKRPSLYGTHAVREAWCNPDRDIQQLLITASALKSFEHIINKTKHLSRPAPTVLDKDKLDDLMPRGSVHQGIGVVCSDLPEMDIQSLIIRNHDQDNVCLLMLDQVTDPHNVGAILRSAEALGANGLIMQRKHAPDLGGVLAKTACGALEHMPVTFETNLSRTLETLKDAGYFVYGLDERGENIKTMKSGGKTVLILGAEGPGMRRLIKENCDTLLKIPMNGTTESLNVSNAAAIALYQMIGQ